MRRKACRSNAGRADLWPSAWRPHYSDWWNTLRRWRWSLKLESDTKQFIAATQEGILHQWRKN